MDGGNPIAGAASARRGLSEGFIRAFFEICE